MIDSGLQADSRGVSTPVVHTLTLAITAAMVVLLVSTANGFLADQKEFASRDQLDTVGSRLASQLEQVGGMAAESGEATIYVSQPDAIVESSYRVSLESGDSCDTNRFSSETCLVLESTDQGLTRTVPVSVSNEVSLSMRRVGGGTFALSASTSAPSRTFSGPEPSADSRRLGEELRVGVGENVDSNNYGRVIDPTNRSPIPKFRISPDYPTSGEFVRANATDSRDPDGSITEYTWYVDGTEVSSDPSNPDEIERTLSAGAHNVTLDVTDDEGASARRSRTVRVSGLQYNNDMSASSGSSSRCGGTDATFSITNQWSSEISVSHLSIDPPDRVNEIEYTSGPEIVFDMNNDGDYSDAGDIDYYADGGEIDFRDKPDGVVLSLRSGPDLLDITSGQTVGVSVCKFKGGGALNGQNHFPEVGFRYWVDGTTNRTVFGEASGPTVSGYSVSRPSGDVAVSFESSEQLDVSSFAGEIGTGGSSTPIDGSDFTESFSGGTYTYEATFSRPSGTYYVELTDAENTASTEVLGLPKNDSAGGLNTGSPYTWQTAGDWDGNDVSAGLVHDSYGDYAGDSLQLGRPPGSVDGSLVSYWPFDGGSADDVYGSNDGTLENGPSTRDGIAGTSALGFDGSDQYVEVDADSSLEMSDDDTVTVSAWVNKDSAQSGWTALFQKSYTSYNMHFDEGDNFVFTIHDDGYWYSTDEYDLNQDLDRYYHLVGTFDGSRIRSYVDGARIDTNTWPDEIADASSEDVGIGENLDKNNRHLDGAVDDVRVYADALSASQVEQLHNVTEGGMRTGSKTGSSVNLNKLDLTYDADIDSGEQIEVEVKAPKGGPNSRTSDTITLTASDSGTGTVDVDGISGSESKLWLSIRLTSPSASTSPTLDAVTVKEGS